jgi:hypothetical protein
MNRPMNRRKILEWTLILLASAILLGIVIGYQSGI